MESKKHFGSLIKELRVSRKLTQEELSRLAAVPFATINRLERGRANPTLSTLEKILRIFGYKLSASKMNFDSESEES